MAPQPLSISFTGRCLFFSLLLELFSVYVIPLLKDRRYRSWLAELHRPSHLPAPYVVPSFHKTCPPQESNRGHWCPQLTSITTQIYQTNMEPDQISTTDVGISPIIITRCCSSLPWPRNKSRLMWSPIKYLQQTSGIPWSPSGIKHLRCQTPRLPPIFPTDDTAARIISNRCPGSLKYFQPTPGLSNPVLRLLWGRMKYWLPAFLQHARQKHWPFESSKNCISYIFYVCVVRTPFYVKINITVAFASSVF